MAATVGLIRRDPMRAFWHRHPLAFLVEAADDICYRVIDIEDGFRLGHLGYDEVVELFRPVIRDWERQSARLARIEGPKEKVEFLRAKAINEAILQVRDCFVDNEEAILAGRFDEPLLTRIPKTVEMAELIRVAERRVYCAPEVVEIEAAGFEVISELLERFAAAVDDLAEHGEGAKAKSKMVARLIPEQFIGRGRVPSDHLYTRLLRLTDFVAGMTDSYAVSLYKKITGISLPGG